MVVAVPLLAVPKQRLGEPTSSRTVMPWAQQNAAGTGFRDRRRGHAAVMSTTSPSPSPSQTQGTIENATGAGISIVAVVLVMVAVTLLLAVAARFRGRRAPVRPDPDKPFANP
jgi:hypothetical protein